MIRRGASAAFAAVLAFATASAAVCAAPEADAQRIPVALRVNGVDRGDAVLVVEDHDLELRADDLTAAGLGSVTGPIRIVGGQRFVRLSGAKGVVKATFDEQTVTVVLTVDPTLLERQVVDLSAARPTDLHYARVSGGYLNYVVQSAGATAFFDGAVVAPNAVLHQTFSAQAHGGLRRGLTELRFDDVARMRRVTAGDTYVDSGDLGSTVMLTGVTFQRDVKLDPYGTLAPAPHVSGIVDSPSRADVYVNGALVRQVDLQPGTFDVHNLSGLEGVNDAKIVLHDAFGGVRTISTQFEDYGELLRRGTNDYAAGLGGVRTGMLTAADSYPFAAGVARYAVGLRDDLTVGAHAEVGASRRNAGASVDTAFHGLRLHAAAAASASALGSGTAWSASGWTTRGRISAGLTARYTSPFYATLGLDPHTDRVVRSYDAFLGTAIGRKVRAELDLGSSAMRDGTTARHVTARIEAPIGARATLFVTASQTQGSQRGGSYFAGLSLPVGRHGSALVSLDGNGRTAQPAVEIQNGTSGSTGVDTQMLVRGGSLPSANGAIDVRTEYGTSHITYDVGAGRRLAAGLALSGGMAFADGRVTFGRSVDESFALLEAPGLRNGRAFANGQEIGRTNGRGDVLVSNAVANYANRFSVDDGGQQTEQIQTAEATAAPPVHGGTVVRFAVQRLRAIRGRITLHTAPGEVVPAYGHLQLQGPRAASSELGENGEFYFDDVAPGPYRATVVYPGGRCTSAMRIPERTSISTDVGVLRWAC